MRRLRSSKEVKVTAEVVYRGKRILAVDDEPDVLALITEGLPDIEVVTAGDFEQAKRLIESENYHLVLLDIMGVNGFELLKACTARKLPAAMLTAKAITIDSLNLSLKLGAVSFLPKDELKNIHELVAEILEGLEQGKSHWKKLFERMGPLFKEKFGIFWERLENPNPPDPPIWYA
jgi:DNA-binding response OmpR family regulator